MYQSDPFARYQKQIRSSTQVDDLFFRRSDIGDDSLREVLMKLPLQTLLIRISSMKLSISNFFLIVALITFSNPSNGFAQTVTFTSTTTSVVPAAPCDHVIQQLLRHGVNNQCDRSLGARLVTPSLLMCGPNALVEPSDLEIVYANVLPESELSLGPRLAIAIANRSSMEARDFHVSVVAILGQIHPHSPISTVRVERIGPNESLEVMVPLPFEASIANGPAIVTRYDRLIVSVDCFNRISESDEANNVRLFENHQLQQTASNIPSSNAMRIQVPALALLENTAIRSSSSFGSDSHVTVDALDLEQPTPDSLRSAIQSVNPPVVVGKAPTAPPVENPF